jgi:hypothetical protein
MVCEPVTTISLTWLTAALLELAAIWTGAVWARARPGSVEAATSAKASRLDLPRTNAQDLFSRISIFSSPASAITDCFLILS